MGTYLTFSTWLPGSPTSDTTHAILDLTSSDINTATVNSLIDRRERMIESYIGRRYAVPVTQSALITKIGEDLVTYDIYNLLLNKDSGLVEQEIVQANYDLALAMLEDVNSGKAALIDNNGAVVPERNTSNKVYSNMRNFIPTFDVGDYLKWKVSTDRQDSLDEDRSNDN